LTDIQKIELTGRHNLPISGRYFTEATALYFNDGQTRLIYDDMYANSWELKLYLKQVVIDKEKYTVPVIAPVEEQELDKEIFFTYKGNPLFSYGGLVCWSMIAICLCAMVITGLKGRQTVGSALFFIAFSLAWFLAFSRRLYYFEVSDKFMVVKSHALPWKKHVYRLNDMREVVIEPRPKASVYLRLIIKDLSSRLYAGGTLGKNTWLELKKKLESNKVPVRDECFQKT